MKKMLSYHATTPKLFHYNDGVLNEGVHDDISGYSGNIRGDCTKIHGNVTKLNGNVTKISGDVTNLCGYATGIQGNIDLCELTEMTNISELMDF